jgi:hypothetical protein
VLLPTRMVHSDALIRWRTQKFWCASGYAHRQVIGASKTWCPAPFAAARRRPLFSP